MKLKAEQIQMNWVEFMSNIDTYISSPRKEQLKSFYEKFEDGRIFLCLLFGVVLGQICLLLLPKN